MTSRFFIRILLFIICFGGFKTTFGQTDSLSTETIFVKRTVANAPVTLLTDTLFYINSGIGSFSAEERAASIKEKIKLLSKEKEFSSDSIQVVKLDNFAKLVYKDIIIMGVTPDDAEATGKNLYVLAHEYEKTIGLAIEKYKQLRDWRYILIHVSLALLIVVAQYFLIKLVNILFRRISNNTEKLKILKIKTLKVKSYQLLDEAKTIKLVKSCITIVRWLVILLLLYLTIPLIFSVFPPTRGIADKLFGYVLSPLQKILMSLVGYVPNLITIIIIVLVFRYLIKALRYLTEEIHKGGLRIKGFYSDWARPTFNIIRTLLYIFMFIVIFPYLPGSESRVFQGVSVFIGIVFSLGSSSLINNVVSGLVLTYMRPFKVGDRIKIGEIVGNVIEKTPFVTRIRTPKNEEVTIPNSGILSAQTFNYTHSANHHKLILHTEVTFGYDVPWRKVHQLLIDAAERTSHVLKEPKPFVFQTSLDDFFVVYQINIYIQEADLMAPIYSELNQHIQDVFNEAGVEIMSPNYMAHRDGNKTTIPEEYLSGDYKAPQLHVKVTK
ncbi:MAG: mechanosensitive ion channel family protein [Bacteroidales bacterium]|jgi:small-conductance mechanosensitive channel|nr:mechanosensitive ion channel family protein [Bacteroidales bacterium]